MTDELRRELEHVLDHIKNENYEMAINILERILYGRLDRPNK